MDDFAKPLVPMASTAAAVGGLARQSEAYYPLGDSKRMKHVRRLLEQVSEFSTKYILMENPSLSC
jgi:hypothetical protein